MGLHIAFIVFLFVLGACIGSFLNVVIWRMPRGESLVRPPSHCPKCEHRLAWYDNVPVAGWLWLRGRCRYCRQPISVRYPIIEAITGLLLVFYYVAFFILNAGPCTAAWPPRAVQSIQQDWAIYALYMFCICALVAVTMIDAELFIIPLEIPWLMAGVGIIAHALIDTPQTPGALNLVVSKGGQWQPTWANALAAGGAVGLAASIAAFVLGWMPQSFPAGEPSLEIDKDAFEKEAAAAKKDGREPPQPPPVYTSWQIRAEMGKEILFLLPPIAGAVGWLVLTERVPAVRNMWEIATRPMWVTGMLGAALGAMVGGLVVWVARILGTLGFGRIAMGLGDVHLMFGVGAIIGAGAATVAFFLAPFAGVVVGVWGWITRRRHELPLGPYLSLATAVVMLCYCPIAEYLRPGVDGLMLIVGGMLGR